MRRRGYEFKSCVIETAHNRSNGYCQRCGKAANETGQSLQAHHIVPIYIARHVVELSGSVIASLANCEIVCCKCHRREHRRRKTKKHYSPQIQRLLALDTRYMFTKNDFTYNI